MCCICRDPKHFPTVLNFLRDGSAVLPLDPTELRELRAEAQFYNLERLAEVIDSAIGSASGDVESGSVQQAWQERVDSMLRTLQCRGAAVGTALDKFQGAMLRIANVMLYHTLPSLEKEQVNQIIGAYRELAELELRLCDQELRLMEGKARQ